MFVCQFKRFLGPAEKLGSYIVPGAGCDQDGKAGLGLSRGPGSWQATKGFWADGYQFSLLLPALEDRVVKQIVAAVIAHLGPEQAGADQNFTHKYSAQSCLLLF
jgi:hypothetical protein